MNEVVCEQCQEVNQAGATHCRLCGYALPPGASGQTEPEQAPSAEAEELSGKRQCWNCAAEIRHHDNRRCRSCGQPVNPPPAVALRFPGDQVLVCGPGQSLALGRVGDHASVFVPYRNVSRRHARLTVDADGTPWLDPVPDAPNGTFVNGSEIVHRTRLRDGQAVRFANRLTGMVVIPRVSHRQEVS